MRRIIPALIIMMGCQWVQGQHQKAFKREISLISDNDNYNVQKRDGYYTNGFNFSFQKLAVPYDPRTQKVIMRYEIGQKIFNPSLHCMPGIKFPAGKKERLRDDYDMQE